MNSQTQSYKVYTTQHEMEKRVTLSVGGVCPSRDSFRQCQNIKSYIQIISTCTIIYKI
ncbi:hypothetical protein C0J52_09371 [Blattella germanica]|nr:hypothetical protein C0J52_09371 [Blattella germanica]